MGNICSSQPKGDQRPGEKIEGSETSEVDDGEAWTEENLNAHLDKLMKAMQKHNLKKMREEVETDINTFMLNNLLMCIQFFDKFERATESASQFKREKETKINDNLAKGPLEGMILGERRCHLLHGIGHILAQNYIYRSPDNAGEEEYYGNYYFGSDPKNTFMSEGILPLEFLMTWDNLELYQNSDFETLQSMTYSSAKGSPPTLRFCMEEPDAKNNVPRGYLRLQSVDVTAEVPKTPETNDPNYDYTYAGKFSDKASEAASDSEEGALSSGSEVDLNELKNKILTSKSYLHPSSSVQSSLERPNPQTSVKENLTSEKAKAKLSNSELARKRLKEKFIERRPSGILPENYPKLGSSSNNSPRISLAISEHNIPTVKVNDASPVANNHFPFPYGPHSTNALYPPNNPMRPRFKGQSRSANLLYGPSSSSGYDTMDSGPMSRSSSVGSEEIRYKWRQVELKQLFQYPARKRGRTDIEAEKQDPLSPNCFIPMKFELSSDEENSDSESEYSFDCNEPTKEPQYDTRYYLNSTQFSSEYCSEFHNIGVKGGLPPSSVNQAVVLGTTIRCAVECNLEFAEEGEEDCFYLTQTFTPAIHSKAWPGSYYFWFNQRMFNRKNHSEFHDHWPSVEQVERIEKLGSNAVPLGFRSIQFFNTHQSLEWQMNFQQAETLLLNSFKNVHWRAYIFASLIFRAFIAPLGPQGISVDHIRNIIYFMCHEDFVGWNDEQPGVHLRAVISKLFDCLGKGKMPNFFIQSQDLLKSIPQQNARLVQAHLSKIRDNLTVYCIYAFRNLTCVRTHGEFYAMPDFKKLYNIITAPQEKDLLQINNPGLGFPGMGPLEEESHPKKSRKKKKSDKNKLDLIGNDENIEGDFRTFIAIKPLEKPDKMQSKLRRRHMEHERKMKELARQKKNGKLSPDEKIPASERRKSIDLQQLPIIQEKFSTLRKVLIIEFFIKHFINMATKSNEYRAYAQSAMYIMQVENFCEILLDGTYNLGQTTLDREEIEEYKRKCQVLREVVGKEMREYVLSRFSHLKIPTLTAHTNNVFGEWSKNRAFHNNWDFRKLPTPPGSHVDPGEFERMQPQASTSRNIPSNNKKLETPNIAKTLQSIKPLNPIPSAASSAKLARRAESIKFVDKPVGMIRSASRQSIVLMDTFESTDL